MSFRDDLDSAADIADIVAVQQRAQILVAQTAQLAALRDIRDQTRLEALRVQKEKTAQDTLFWLRQSLKGIEAEAESNSHKAAADVVIAEQMLVMLPPDIFSSLEWKDLSLTVNSEVGQLTQRLCERFGTPMVRELAELRTAARENQVQERKEQINQRRQLERAIESKQAAEANRNRIAWIIAIVVIVGFLIVILFALANAQSSLNR